MGAMLVIRTLAAEIPQSLAFAGLVGMIIIRGVHGIEGPGTALIVASVFLGVVLVSLASRLRGSVGRQHLFLLLHRPASSSPVWRHLVRGEAAAFGLVALAAYLLVVLPTPEWRQAGAVWVLGGLVVEWAVYLALAAHLFAPALENDNLLRLVLLQGAAPLLLLAVVMKGLTVGYFVSPWLVPVQSVGCCVGALALTVRAPLALGGAGASRRVRPVNRQASVDPSHVSK
jgi:hypothetical protein